ncbi:MAG: hypothetical protein WBC04_21340 [Candidatus Acidiferrales bacterium]
MKKQAFALAVGLLLSSGAASVCYAQRTTVGVNIPFAFQVDNKTLPAGEYQVWTLPTGDGNYRQLIQRTDCSASVIVMTLTADSKDARSEPKLVFNQYGNSYFLSQIWTEAGPGRQLLKSKREKEAALSGARTEVALLAQPSPVKP